MRPTFIDATESWGVYSTDGSPLQLTPAPEKAYNKGVETSTLQICRFGDPVLQTPAARILQIDGTLQQLVDAMKETMYRAPGVGLAAPQIGRSLSLATVDATIGEGPGEFFVLINPEILETEGAETDDEGCLSLPGFTMPVRRHRRIVVRTLDLEGREAVREFTGFLARVVQHEVDHLQGRLILDRVSSLKRKLVKQEIKKLKNSGDW